MKNYHKLILCLICLCFLPGISFAQESTTESDGHILIYVKGKLLETDELLVKKDRVFLPLRLMGESLGYKVNYHGANQEIELKNGTRTVTMNIGKNVFQENGKSKPMDVAPFIQNEKTFLPARAIAEAFGEDVDWDGDNRVVMISHYANPKMKGNLCFREYSFYDGAK